MAKDNKKNISRRDFLKVLGAGTAASAALLAGCRPTGRSNTSSITGEVPGPDRQTYRTNPHTGDRVSLLGYGCMRWPFRPTADGQGQEIDQDLVNELVDYAIEHGVNYFDTAPGYARGLSEEATGIALKRHPREKFFVATKLSNMGDDAYTRSREGSIAMYEQSFRRLQVDYIDYYLLHSIGTIEGVNSRFIDNGMIDFLLREKEAGRIRNLGWSFHGDVEAFDYLLAYKDIQWDFCQIQLNYIDWQHASGRNVNAEYLYAELQKKNVPAVIMEPLLGGRLSRLNSLTQAPLRQLRPDDTPATWAFRYAGTPEGVLTVLSGMTQMEHLQENLRTYGPLEPLNEQEYAALEDVTQYYLNEDFIPCTECQYCMPCKYGIDIPGVFAHYNKVVNEQRMPDDAGDPEYRKYRRQFLVGYDRSVPKLRQAKQCIGCGICKPECPQRIPIPDEMVRIDEFVENLRREKVSAY
ncbi:MAG: aldo/keto reductase [Rikenellaceae bacterium]|nr:aldo/keto reductase [Rikenellaceae bacterium]